MDAHSFRLVCPEWLCLLSGARVEKIHGPLPQVVVFSIFSHRQKCRCFLRFERQNPLFFVSGKALANPSTPPASIMRLRKYAAGKRLGQGIADVATRSLAFPLQGIGDGLWFHISLREGIRIVAELPQGFGQDLVWPAGEDVAGLCDIPWNKQEQSGFWLAYPVLTPLLRESLASLDIMEGRALLVDLEAGGGELFPYANAAGIPVMYSAWPLPEALCKRRHLHAVTLNVSDYAEGMAGFAENFPLLAVTSSLDAQQFFAGEEVAFRQERQQPQRQEAKRAERLMAKLVSEEKRLCGLVARKEDACCLQENLWKFPVEARLAEFVVENTDRRIPLNPLLSLRENMAFMFRQAERGARGLILVRERLSTLRRESAILSAEGAALQAVASPVEKVMPGTAVSAMQTEAHSVLSSTEEVTAREPISQQLLSEYPQKKLAGAGEKPRQSGRGKEALSGNTKEGRLYKHVARFISSDGYVLLRGKNAEGNQALLKIGSPHDYWLHATDGPSAHLLIRRAHGADEVPEETFAEAALLVGLKSWQRNDAAGDVMVAFLRHVHAIKGAAPGTVRVEQVVRTRRWKATKNLSINKDVRGQ